MELERTQLAIGNAWLHFAKTIGCPQMSGHLGECIRRADSHWFRVKWADSVNDCLYKYSVLFNHPELH